MSALFLVTAFLKWEAAYATLPEDISKQVAVLLQLFGTGWLPILVMLLLGITLFAVGLGPDRLEAWVRWVSQHRTTRPKFDEGQEAQPQILRTLNDEALKQRCRKLSEELFEFYRQEQKDLNKRLRWTALARESSDRIQIRREATALQNKETMDKYREQLGSDVLALVNDLAKGDWVTPEDRKRLKNLTEPQDIQYIAQCLRAICGKSSRV